MKNEIKGWKLYDSAGMKYYVCDKCGYRVSVEQMELAPYIRDNCPNCEKMFRAKNTLAGSICRDAITLFGARNQEAQAVEECAELIQAINKKWRGKEHNIAEEIADVEIMLEQLKIINNCFAKVEEIKILKLQYLHGLIMLNDKEPEIYKGE